MHLDGPETPAERRRRHLVSRHARLNTAIDRVATVRVPDGPIAAALVDALEQLRESSWDLREQLAAVHVAIDRERCSAAHLEPFTFYADDGECHVFRASSSRQAQAIAAERWRDVPGELRKGEPPVI